MALHNSNDSGTQGASPFGRAAIQRFAPAPWAPGGDLQTLLGYVLPSPRSISRETRRRVPLPDGDVLLAVENLPASPADRPPVMLLVHGLGGSSDSPYMRRYAARFAEAGWIAVRLNLRGAGAGAPLARGMYNAGSSADLSAAVAEMARLHPESPIAVAGFSIGGNVLLKYLGERQLDKPAALIGAIAACPPIDLADCARNLSRARNVLYGFKFITVLRLEARKHPELEADLRGLSLTRPMTMESFDHLVTAPAGGFESGRDYYEQCSAARFLDDIETPTLLLATDDDPFIPAAV
jgi:predicted alpha/beta-fold hydrolase